MRLITYTNLKKYIYIFRAQNIFRWFQLNYCAGKETEIYRWFTNYPNKYFVPNKTRPRTQSWLKFCWLCLKLLFKKVLFFLLTDESYTDYNVSKTDEIKHFFFFFQGLGYPIVFWLPKPLTVFLSSVFPLPLTHFICQTPIILHSPSIFSQSATFSFMCTYPIYNFYSFVFWLYWLFLQLKCKLHKCK